MQSSAPTAKPGDSAQVIAPGVAVVPEPSAVLSPNVLASPEQALDTLSSLSLGELIRQGDDQALVAALSTEVGRRELAEDGLSLLRLAIQQGSHATCTAILDQGIEVTLEALMLAVQEGDPSKLEQLLQRVDPSIASSHVKSQFVEPTTPLHLAATLGYTKIVELLINHGASSTTQDETGRTASEWALISGHGDVLELFLTRDEAGEVNTLLHTAVRAGLVDMTLLLLQHGADPEASDRRGYTALHFAILFDQNDLVRLLLDHGADAQARDSYGRTPRELALAGLKPNDMVELLP